MIKYGTEKVGKLKKVLLHNPSQAITMVTKRNYKFYLFNKYPNFKYFLSEHQRYAKFLKSYGVEVCELSDYVADSFYLLSSLPNLAYLHDIAVITNKGAILSRMCPGGRQNEELVVKEALKKLGIPIWHQFGNPDQFEGCLLLSPTTIFLANTERHTKKSINRFIPKALEMFDEVIYVNIPKLRRFMHPDMIFNRINNYLALAYLPAFLDTYLITKDGKEQIDFKSFLAIKGIELIEVTNKEQLNWACSFVPLEPNVIIHYDFSLNKKTQDVLSSYGIRILKFHPNALLAGGGSLRCLTLQLLVEP